MKTFVRVREGTLAVDSDEFEPFSSGDPTGLHLSDVNGRDLPASMPGGRGPTLRAAQGEGGASDVTAIAIVIINSFVITHSVIIAMIVTILVLVVAFAME